MADIIISAVTLLRQRRLHWRYVLGNSARDDRFDFVAASTRLVAGCRITKPALGRSSFKVATSKNKSAVLTKENTYVLIVRLLVHASYCADHGGITVHTHGRQITQTSRDTRHTRPYRSMIHSIVLQFLVPHLRSVYCSWYASNRTRIQYERTSVSGMGSCAKGMI